ncbi:MAG: hypothetical protein OHK0039_44590 [Bacteroidia bacterium]
MSFFRRIYTTAQWLSLDVAVGSLASGMMAARYLGVAMPPGWYVALPLSVWVIYTTDHLMDAYRLGAHAHTARHLFHHRHFGVLAVCWALALLGSLALLPMVLPPAISLGGYALGVLVLGHLGLVWWIGGRVARWLAKELGVGAIYALGVWLGPAALSARTVSAATGLVWAQFLMLALANLLIFSIYEEERDRLDQQSSFVRAIGATAARQVLAGLLGLAAAAGLAVLWLDDRPVAQAVEATYLLMGGVLAGVAWRPGWFGQQERYRLWGDLVFLFPLWTAVV